MAWRDSRTSRRRLSFYMTSIALGVAALVALSSSRENLGRAVDEQSKSLLGADLMITNRHPFNAEAEKVLSTVPGRRALEVNFASMAYFPRQQGTRLVDVRALQGDYPFYGSMETEPRAGYRHFRSSPDPVALVDHTLLLQFGAAVGDPIKLGKVTFTIVGSFRKVPGESPIESIVGPRVYIPLSFLKSTGLVQTGSRVGYRAYFKLAAGQDAAGIVERIRPDLVKLGLRSATAEERKDRLGRSLDNFYRFLNLVGFTALLLGGIGVASAVHLYAKSKLPVAALLRCMGARSSQTLKIFVIQCAVLGAGGAVLGALLGVAVQALIPGVLADFLPVHVRFSLSWVSIIKGLSLGFILAVLFAMLPLLPIRRVSPLLTLRMDGEQEGSGRWDPWLLLVYAALLILVLGFAVGSSESWKQGVAFLGGLLLVVLLLSALALMLMKGIRKFFPSSWSYVWRQGLANLYRPHNQTVVLILTLGLGTFLVVTLFLVQESLLKQVEVTGSRNRPNLVLFDIQSDQKKAVTSLVRSQGLPILQDVPIVTMRLAAINGETVEKIRAEGKRRIHRWALLREYRCTYRNALESTEKIVAGKWIGRAEAQGEAPVPVSVEQRIARDLGLKLGDRLRFDVQGVPVSAYVASLRDVNWERVQPNFFVVFPEGVLEEAPQFHVLVTRAPSEQVSAAVQKEVVRKFPNVSCIDLALILKTVDSILDRVSFVLHFMALFSVITGLVVLAGAVLSSRFQRIREGVLLRTLGASRRQVSRIMLAEYVFLGGLAAGMGVLLAMLGAWSLTHFVLQTPFALALGPVLAAVIVIVFVTVAIGMLNSRGVCDRPPLEILRAEG